MDGYVGDALYAETPRYDPGTTADRYIASARERYCVKIEPTAGQGLEQFVAEPEHAWRLYDRNANVLRYDFAGNDVEFHNSNSAMVASIEYAAGRTSPRSYVAISSRWRRCTAWSGSCPR